MTVSTQLNCLKTVYQLQWIPVELHLNITIFTTSLQTLSKQIAVSLMMLHNLK